MGCLISTNRRKWVKAIKAKREQKAARGIRVDHYNCGYYYYKYLHQKTLPQIQVNFWFLTYNKLYWTLTLPSLSVTESHTFAHTQLWTCSLWPSSLLLYTSELWFKFLRSFHLFLCYSFLTTLASQGVGFSPSAGNCSTRLCSSQPHIPQCMCVASSWYQVFV